MLDEQQIADGLNGAVPAIDSGADNEAAPHGTDDEREPPPEPEKSTAEKKKD